MVFPQFDYHKSYPHWTLLWGLLGIYLAHSTRSPMLGHSSKHPSLLPRLTRPLETVCILLLDLVVALAKFLLVFIFSLEEKPIRASFLSWQPSLRAFYLTSIHNIFSWPISTFLLFSRIGKPVLESFPHPSCNTKTCNPYLGRPSRSCFVLYTILYGVLPSRALVAMWFLIQVAWWTASVHRNFSTSDASNIAL